MAFFFEDPYSEVYLRDLSRRLKANASTVLRVLKILESEGLVSRRVERNAVFFKAVQSGSFKALKTAFTLSKFARVVPLFLEKSRGLACVLLYGSAAKGEDGPSSDYDVLCVAADCGVTGAELGGLLGRETNLRKFTMREWAEAGRTNRAFYLSVLSDSIALYGEKPVID